MQTLTEGSVVKSIFGLLQNKIFSILEIFCGEIFKEVVVNYQKNLQKLLIYPKSLTDILLTQLKFSVRFSKFLKGKLVEVSIKFVINM